MVTGTDTAAQVQHALLVEKRWDLISMGVSTSVGFAGYVVGGSVNGALGLVGPFLGLAAMYVVLRFRARSLGAEERVAASLHLERDRNPWTWAAVFALSTWAAAELASFVFSFVVSLTLGHWFPDAAPADVQNAATATTVDLALFLVLLQALIVLPTAVVAGRALGMREGIHPYRWTAVGALAGRLLFVASMLLFVAWMDVELEMGATIGFHVVSTLVIFAAGAFGAWLGSRRRSAYRVATLYRSLPGETQHAAYDLLAEEARRLVSPDAAPKLG